jgi:hypothetical protein
MSDISEISESILSELDALNGINMVLGHYSIENLIKKVIAS